MSVTGPAGFLAAGAACGIKDSGAPDIAVVCSETHQPVPAAAVFTSNKAKAAPVLVSRRHLNETGGMAAAVVVSSGNANAQTGKPGVAAAERMCELAADGIGCEPAAVLVCQTGLIGVRFPVDRVESLESGIPNLVRQLAPGPEAAEKAARAIMTTDTFCKQVLIDRPGFSVGGIAKGAAMLAPHMATMLAVLTTDARVDPAALRAALRVGVTESFNEMTVDGCCSTNDTVVVLSSGRAKAVPEADLRDALVEACAALAEMMVTDAEGATKVARILVKGAASDTDARRAARQVASSLLVKCSLNGADPYWGRVVSELGSAGVEFDPDSVSVAYGGVRVCAGGVAVPHDEAAVFRHLAGGSVEIECDLDLGAGSASVLTCDLGHGYIDENRATS